MALISGKVFDANLRVTESWEQFCAANEAMRTVVVDSPLARAVRTKSELNTCSIDARVMRAMGASTKIAIVSVGSTISLNAAHHSARSPASKPPSQRSPATALAESYRS